MILTNHELVFSTYGEPPIHQKHCSGTHLEEEEGEQRCGFNQEKTEHRSSSHWLSWERTIGLPMNVTLGASAQLVTQRCENGEEREDD